MFFKSKAGNAFYTEPNGKYLGFAGQTVSVATTQDCYKSMKAVIDNIEMNKMAVFQ